MIKPAFSSLACPGWTLDTIAAAARRMGFEAVELRTFGDDSRLLAGDPALTSTTKARTLLAAAGVEVACLATSCRFDAPVFPPVIGHVIADQERTIREAQRAIDLAVGLECPIVRVFAFEGPENEPRASLARRVAERLRLVTDHADKTGAKVVIENGGSFASAQQIAELVTLVGSPLLGICYNPLTGYRAGDEPVKAIATFGGRLWAARLIDADEHGIRFPGEGKLDSAAYVERLAALGFDGPLIAEWDRLRYPDLAPAEDILPRLAQQMSAWIGLGLKTAATLPRSVVKM